jgi:CBS domain-containing protein
MKVKDVMHKGVDWVSPDTPVTELAKLMREHDIGAIPIGENDRLIGMVTDRDIVCKGLAQDSFDAGRATAGDVMTPGIHCCREDDDLAKAIRHMETLKVRRLPVINKSKRMRDRVEYRLGVVRRARDDAQDLACRGLLLQRLAQLALHTR